MRSLDTLFLAGTLGVLLTTGAAAGQGTWTQAAPGVWTRCHGDRCEVHRGPTPPDQGPAGSDLFGQGGTGPAQPEPEAQEPARRETPAKPEAEEDPFGVQERFANTTLWNPETFGARRDAAILIRPSNDRIRELGQDGELPYTTRERLREKYGLGSELSPDDPWYFTQALTEGGTPVHFYDAGGKQEPMTTNLMWWKPGQGWVRLADEKPADMDAELHEQYLGQYRRDNPPPRELVPESVVQAGGGIRDRYDHEQGQVMDRTYTSASTGNSYRPRNYYDDDQGVVLENGGRAGGSGYTVYSPESEGARESHVRWGHYAWDAELRRTVFRGVSGTKPDGTPWYAEKAWWGDQQNLSDPQFEGIVYGDEARARIEGSRT